MWDFRVLRGKVKIEVYVLDSGNMLFIENSSSTISHDVGTHFVENRYKFTSERKRD